MSARNKTRRVIEIKEISGILVIFHKKKDYTCTIKVITRMINFIFIHTGRRGLID